jgi:hypothetical protein
MVKRQQTNMFNSQYSNKKSSSHQQRQKMNALSKPKNSPSQFDNEK